MNVIWAQVRQSGITPNGPRIREAVLHIIREADSRNLEVSQFDILKTLFLADREHLNKYGRPITFDQYVAMADGPVASVAYDLLKDALWAREVAGMTGPLWESAQGSAERKRQFFNAARDASPDILSETDLEELSAALQQVKATGFKAIWDRVHADKAYVAAWTQRGESGRHPMDYALMLNEPDSEYADELKFLSEFL